MTTTKTDITIELSDQAIADLDAVRFRLRALWKEAPELADYEPTESDAARVALSSFMASDWSIADLLPPEPKGSA